MIRHVSLVLIVMAGVARAGDSQPGPAAPPPCSDAWYRTIAGKVATGDDQGHGPDIGSDEWKSVVEFRLGVRGKPGVPSRDSESWCRYIDQLVSKGATPGDAASAPGAAAAVKPSFDCAKVERASIEAMICEDAALAGLDRKLADVYAAASRKASNEHPPRLKAEQRGWVKGRDECWKSDARRACVRDEYVRRIAELQATYRLVPGAGPVRYACDGNPASEVVATFFETEPPTLVAERGDSISLMFLQPAASGAKYQGRNETFWEHHGEAMIQWGYGAPEMNCQKKP